MDFATICLIVGIVVGTLRAIAPWIGLHSKD